MTGKINDTLVRVRAWTMQRTMAKIGKARRKARERAEKPTPRLSAEQRAERYRKQTGARTLTPRQRHRIAKKEGHTMQHPRGAQ